MKRYIVELIGTFWLIFMGCGSSIITVAFPEFGISYVGVALAFGFSILTIYYAVGGVLGCHLNPAVTIGAIAAKRTGINEGIKYIAFQLLGATLGAGILYLIVTDNEFMEIESFASNGFGKHSPLGFGIIACFITEFIMTFFFVFIFLRVTLKTKNSNLSGLIIGLSLTLIHLVSIPITNASVNPARSTSQAIFTDLIWPLEQLWLFWLAPLSGGIIAGLVYRKFNTV